jgi:thioredoxin reductase (NADPH)
MTNEFERKYKKYKAKYILARMENMTMYDLIVVGGGSAGLVCANEAIKHGKKVAVFNYVEPTLKGTNWGLGGTCLNVGCVPKKLFKHAGYIGNILSEEAEHFGWNVEKVSHDWEKLKDGVQTYIKSQNYKNIMTLNENNIDFYNHFVKFVDKNIIEVVDDEGDVLRFRGDKFIIATGCRPTIPNYEGFELGITSDDLFSLEHNPGKVLVVGGSYIALECATMLKALMCDVTVMVRSKFLRKFDEDMVKILMKGLNLNTMKNTDIIKIEVVDGKKRVWYDNKKDKDVYIDVDTVLFAMGRSPNVRGMGLDAIGIKIDGKIIVDKDNRTSVDNIFAVGDVSNDFELNTIAVQSGKYLIDRLYNGGKRYINYNVIPSVVFTLPVEYAFVGLSEMDAINKYGDVEVYHEYTDPIELASMGVSNTTYIKIICEKVNKKVLGIHMIGHVASEIIQGYCLALNNNLTIHDINNIMGIHPTVSETVVNLHITKSSGISPKKESC